jgi:hypothetical protein
VRDRRNQTYTKTVLSGAFLSLAAHQRQCAAIRNDSRNNQKRAALSIATVSDLWI